MSTYNNNNTLFPEFPPVSNEQWEAIIQEDLKGADYEKKLIWKTTDGLKIKPYYRAADLEQSSLPNALPGAVPFVRGQKIYDNNWLIRQDIGEDTPEAANLKAREALAKGAESVALNVSNCTSVADLKILLSNIALDKVTVHYFGASSYIQLADNLVLATQRLGFDPQVLKGSFNFDCIGYFLSHNKFYASPDSNFVELSLILDKAKRDLPGIKVINVNADAINNSGGSLTQEIAYALAIGTEYLTQLTAKGQPIDDIASRIQFSFAIGSNYFLEIAKIRAARLLWAAIVQQFNPLKEASAYMNIHSITSAYNKTLYDPYVNMLRCTTEAMSAAIGGCDSMTVLPFDFVYSSGNKLSERVARNLQIILKEEAFFNKVADAAAGSYYIENLTEIVSEGAWKLFLDTEQKGGFIACAQSGHITEAIEAYAVKKQDELATRKQILLGTNQYPNYSETMLDKMAPATETRHINRKKTTRLAQPFEALRLATEDYTSKGHPAPAVFLLTIGNLAMRKARAGFALNFFACAGYKVIDNSGFKTAQEGIKTALSSPAQIIVICSSDDEYAAIGPEIIQGIKSADASRMVVIAGNPPAADALRVAGADEFIHVRTNVLDALNAFSRKLGII